MEQKGGSATVSQLISGIPLELLAIQPALTFPNEIIVTSTMLPPQTSNQVVLFD